MTGFVNNGFYVFQDYAVVHWIDHLEAVLGSLEDSDSQQDDFKTSFTEFYEFCSEESLVNHDIREEHREQFKHIKDFEYAEKMLQLCSYTRRTRGADHKVTALGKLGEVVSRSRSIIEGLSLFRKNMIHGYYGSNLYKCSMHECYYFHEGFPDARRRNIHMESHEKPFLCTEQSCPRQHVGFSTEEDLSKLTAINHPDPSVFGSRVPRVKKALIMYECNICSKQFTRESTLLAHSTSHGIKRPHSCSFCEMSFNRKSDCMRHQKNVHAEEKEKVVGDRFEADNVPE
jgi:hypothetical protein